MGFYLDISNSEYSAKGVAEQNRMNGVTGHTLFGVLATNLAPQLICSIGNILGGGSKEATVDTSNSAEETDKTLEYGRQQKEYNKAYMEYKANPTNKTASALKKAFENLDNNFNGYSRMKDQYKGVEAEVKKLTKK